MNPEAESDEALIAACLRGDQAAWATLVNKYNKLVYSVPLKFRMTPDDAADIFQAVWIDLFADLGNLRNAGALRSWLATVALHKCYQWKRRQIRNGESSLDESDAAFTDPSPSFARFQEETEREQILRDAIARLPDRCRTMVRLLFFEQPPLPYAEVAARLGLAEGSIGFIRGRCLKKLRQTLESMAF
ncbi:MAG: polymerase, sigma-24 subunit, subfamily [Bryobacterales bacterium]|nr:polymerase, sigma-24 subunit, subfamily [Bryobacterales bacterium]